MILKTLNLNQKLERYTRSLDKKLQTIIAIDAESVDESNIKVIYRLLKDLRVKTVIILDKQNTGLENKIDNYIVDQKIDDSEGTVLTSTENNLEDFLFELFFTEPIFINTNETTYQIVLIAKENLKNEVLKYYEMEVPDTVKD